MAYENTEQGFIDYRYYKPKYHYTKKIALKIDVNQDEGLISYSCAICSEEDNFCRATARELTDKRMDAGEVFTGMFDREKTLVDNIRDITGIIATGNDPAQPASRMVKQLHEAFAEVEISKVLDDTPLFSQQEV